MLDMEHLRPTVHLSAGRCGFANVAEVLDPNDGSIWRWELSLPDQ